MSTEGVTIDTGTPWRRTSPIAVVFYLLKFARSMVTDGLPALAPAVAVFATADGWIKTASIVGLSVLVLLGVIGAVLSYLRFRFRLTDDQILVRRGVFRREQLNLGFDRIQDVAIDEPFYVRPFGLGILNLDTAGSAKKEVTLAGIPLATARQMRDQMIRQVPVPKEEPGDSGEHVSEQFLLSRNKADIARYGLTANGLLWVAIFLGVVFSSIDEDAWLGPLAKRVAEIIRLEGLSNFVQSLGTLATIAFVLATVLLAGLLLPLLSVIGALWKYADYRLTVDGSTYHRRSGLVSKQEQTLRRAKIQAAVWRQNVVARWLARVNLQLRLVSAGEAAANSQGIPTRQPAFLVPALMPDEAHDLSAEFLPSLNTREIQFSPIHRSRYMRKTVLLVWLPPIAAVTIGAIIVLGWVGLLTGAAALALAVGGVYLRWKRFGYGTTGSYGCLREGFFGHTTTLFPLYKLQRVDLRQSPAQRRADLANLTIHLASHSITMPYMPLGDARRFADLVLHQAESSKDRWF